MDGIGAFVSIMVCGVALIPLAFAVFGVIYWGDKAGPRDE